MRMVTPTGPPPDLVAAHEVVALDVHGVVFNNPLPWFLAELGARSELGSNRFKQMWRSTWRLPFWEGRVSEEDMWAGIAPGLDPACLRADLERRYRPGPWVDFAVAQYADRVLVSDALGAAKPSPAAFAPRVEHCSVVFFDDSHRNVDAARALGLSAARVARPADDLRR